MKQIGEAISFREASPSIDEIRNRSVSKSILLLLTLKSNGDDISKELAGAYHIAVKNETAQTVAAAVQNFIRGLVKDQNAAFCPTPPQLARECRRIFTRQFLSLQGAL